MIQTDRRTLDSAGGGTGVVQVTHGDRHLPAERHRTQQTDPVTGATRTLLNRTRKLPRAPGILATNAFDVTKIGGWSRGAARHMPHGYRLHAVKD
jgi:hypothetical protein